MKQTLHSALSAYFGYESFRTGQEEILTTIMEGKHTLGVLPTGTGKSICYQLPAYMLPGTVIVVSPLLSLMEDQVKQLQAKGLKQAAALNSFLSWQEKRRLINELHRYKLIYLSPEQLQNKAVLSQLKSMQILLFVIDEAHCISQWGPEFRPDYLRLPAVIQELGTPTVLALTGTATPNVQDDIVRLLGDLPMERHIYPMDRDNISFHVRFFDQQQEKSDYVLQLIHKYQVPTIIYFSSRAAAEKMAGLISSEITDSAAAFYHGGMENEERILIQQQFLSGQLRVICCTSAFGMGINKENVRLIVHYHFSHEKEAFIQEVGRAGRDGKESASIVLYAPGDSNIPENLIDQDLPDLAEVKQLLNLFYRQTREAPQPLLQYEQVIEYVPISETQWRFLLYQLEKHDIVKENKILSFSREYGSVFLQHIEHHIRERNVHKMNSLAAMKRWIFTESCRRRELFLTFQDEIKAPAYRCCDNCGDNLHDWNPQSIAVKQETQQNWKKQLKLILQQ